MAKKKPAPPLEALRQAAKGLKFVSETEAPLEPFAWKAEGELTEDAVRKQAKADPDTPVEAMTLEDFFRAAPPEDKPKFDRLAQALKGLLSGVKVYKVGEEGEKEAYIVGKTADGQWAGLKTTVVET